MNDLKAGIPVLGILTKTLEKVTPDKGAAYHSFTVNDYDLGYVTVRIYGDINETMKKHLETEGAGIFVNAETVSPWVPETDGKVKRYEKEGTYRTGKVIINYSATANGYRLRFLPRVTESGASTQTSQAQASTGDTVRGGNDSEPAKQEAPATADSGATTWDNFKTT